MPPPERHIDLAAASGPTVRRFPAADDPDERYDAIIDRGRSMRRRRVAVRSGTVLGATATLVLTAVLVAGRDGQPQPVVTPVDDPVTVASEQVTRNQDPPTILSSPTGPPIPVPVPGCDDPAVPCTLSGLSVIAGAPGPAEQGTADPAQAPPGEPVTPAPNGSVPPPTSDPSAGEP